METPRRLRSPSAAYGASIPKISNHEASIWSAAAAIDGVHELAKSYPLLERPRSRLGETSDRVAVEERHALADIEPSYELIVRGHVEASQGPGHDGEAFGVPGRGGTGFLEKLPERRAQEGSLGCVQFVAEGETIEPVAQIYVYVPSLIPVRIDFRPAAQRQ